MTTLENNSSGEGAKDDRLAGYVVHLLHRLLQHQKEMGRPDDEFYQRSVGATIAEVP
jgi:hypothetical protein